MTDKLSFPSLLQSLFDACGHIRLEIEVVAYGPMDDIRFRPRVLQGIRMIILPDVVATIRGRRSIMHFEFQSEDY